MATTTTIPVHLETRTSILALGNTKCKTGVTYYVPIDNVVILNGNAAFQHIIHTRLKYTRRSLLDVEPSPSTPSCTTYEERAISQLRIHSHAKQQGTIRPIRNVFSHQARTKNVREKDWRHHKRGASDVSASPEQGEVCELAE